MVNRDDLREFYDTETTRKYIYDNTLEALSTRFPIEDDNYRLELTDLHYSGPQDFSLPKQKAAILSGRRLTTPITGTWRLLHKPTGNVLDERSDVVMRVPYYTNRGTIIQGGNEYSIVNQARLRPGAYVRRQRTGEIETHFNVKPGTGRSFRLHLKPDTGMFTAQVGQANMPIYPLMKAMGHTDADIIKAWGPDVANANANINYDVALDKLYKQFSGYKYQKGLTPDEKAQYIAESLPNFNVDPDVIERTLGLTNTSGVTKDAILRATTRMLNVNRGHEDPDDRDSPQFSRYYGPEDLLKERIEKDAGRLSRSLLFKAKRAGNLSRIYRGALDPYYSEFILSSGLAMPLEETNPLQNLEQLTRVTKLGQGGIGSAEAITDEARDVNPGQFGFIDPVQGPESQSIGIDTRVAYRTLKGKDGNLYTEVKGRDGKLKYINTAEAAKLTIGFPGQDGDNIVAMRNGKLVNVPKSEVDVVVPSLAHMFGSNTNLNPMPTGVQAGRQFYGAKFWSQYMPQLEGDVPLVDSLMDDNTTFSEYYGNRVGTLRSKNGGTVVSADDNKVVIKNNDGTKETIELVKNLPFNMLTSISYYPAVQKGDNVEPGGRIAHSNFTDKDTGSLKLGRNIKTAIIPYRGFSHEDAYVISESAAKKLSTDRLQSVSVETKHDVSTDRNKYVSLFPDKFSKDQVSKIDKNGIIKVGSTVNKGDPIILATGPKLLTPGDAQLGRLHSALRKSRTDRSEVWEYDHEGTVVDALKTSEGAIVNIRSTPPVAVGDKLCYSDDTEILTRSGWKLISKLRYNDTVASLCPYTNTIDYIKPSNYYDYHYAGTMVNVNDSNFDFLVTPNHNMYCRVSDNFEFIVASDINTNVDYRKLGLWRSKTSKFSRFIRPIPVRQYVNLTIANSITNNTKLPRWLFDVGHSDLADLNSIILKLPLINLDLASSLQHLALHAGISVNIVKVNEYYSLDIVPDISTVELNKHTKVEYEGRVYCVELPKWHTLYVRRNGKAGWSGNSTRFGLKGVCGIIKKDDDMPRDPATGEPYELLLNPMTVLSRVAPNQIVELALGKLAKLTGKQVRLPQLPPKEGWAEYASNLLEQHGIKDSSDIFDPESGKTIKNIGDGYVYLSAFHHLAEDKLSNRGSFGGLTSDYQPSKGGKTGSKRWCFTGDQSIRVIYGYDTIGNIVDNKIKTKVLTLDNGAWVYRDITNWFKRVGNTSELIKLTILRDNTNIVLNITKNHEIYTTSGVVRAEDIKLNDTVLTYFGDNSPSYYTGHAKVIDIQDYSNTNTNINLYDIEVDSAHKYLASDILVSNSSMDVLQTLAHGAPEVLKDAIVIRGSENDDYWRALRHGLPLPKPKIPFVYDKFINTLKAGGINIVDEGSLSQVMPMTDNAVAQLSKGKLENSSGVDTNLKPVQGGLFDIGKTGGTIGNRWTHIELPEPVPNPAMEEPIRRVLGLTIKDMENILAGKSELNGKTGGTAIREALSNIDIDKEISIHKDRVRTTRGANRDNSIKVIGYLNAAKSTEIHPAEWTISKVPVIPPVFRPVSKLGDVALSADLNELYRDVFESSKSLTELRSELPDSELAEERLNLYNSVKAAYGLGEPITPEGQSKRLKGAIRQVIGTQPKEGAFQAKVVSKTVSNVGRGVITPNPNLSMDQVGIPEDSAWSLYNDFVMRRLVRQGFTPVRALELIERREPTARDALKLEMDDRPVILDRAPTWHKFNLVALRPHIIDENVVRLSPLITKGMAGDHDGDLQFCYILLLISSDALAELNIELNEKDLLTLGTPLWHSNDVKTMNNDLSHIIPIDYDGAIIAVDLADVPRGKLLERVNGAKGPIDIHAALEGTKVLSFADDGTIVWADILYWSKHYQREIELVNLSNGRQIITDDDPRAVFGLDPKSGNLDMVRDTPRNAKARNLIVPTVNNTGKLYEDAIGITSVSTDSFDFNLDFDFGWFLGAMAGDGWWDRKDYRQGNTSRSSRRIYISDNRGTNAARVKDYLSSITDDLYCNVTTQTKANDPSRYGDTTRYAFSLANSTELTDFLSLHLGGERDSVTSGCGNKRLPNFAFTAPFEFRKGLLTGIIDTDGTVSLSNGVRRTLYISLSSTSLRLIRDTQLLCRTLGIRSTISSASRPNLNPAWVLSLSTVDCKLASIFDNLATKHKLSNFNNSNVNLTRVYCDNVVLPDHIIATLLSNLRYKENKGNRDKLYAAKAKNVISRAALRKIKASLDLDKITETDLGLLTDYFDFINDNISWAYIKDVELTGIKEDGYDLTVPGYETFTSVCGLVISNTANFHVPVDDKAKEQAKEKMVPSANLFKLTDLKSVMHAPTMEMTFGLYQLTKKPSNKPVKTFKTKLEAKQAYRQGLIKANDPIRILET